MEEIWKPIKWSDGEYEVSNLGNVRPSPDAKAIKRKHVLKYQSYPYMNNGRPYVILTIKGKRRAASVSKVVAEAFVENPWGFSYVREKDGDPMNCRADNIEWVSRSKKVQLVSYKNSAVRCRCIELDRICDTISEMARVLGVTPSAVSTAIRFGRKVKKRFTVIAVGKVNEGDIAK